MLQSRRQGRMASSFSSQGIVLVEHVEDAVLVHQPVGIVEPAPPAGEMIGWAQDCHLLSLMLADIHEEIRPALVREGQEGAQDQLAARPDLHLIPLPAGDDGDVQIIVFA